MLLNTGEWQVALDPGTVAFGSLTAGATSAARTVTLTNEGTTDLAVSGVALAGPDPASFDTAGDTCTGATLAPDAACNVQVRFHPLRVGLHDARLEFRERRARGHAVGGAFGVRERRR